MDAPGPSRRSRIAAVTVFAIAVTLRMPSCYESFWLDELHSAWAVWGALSDVAQRAGAGHQSPLYFYGLWFWKQIVGENELALRMSSVIATALSCAILTVGVTTWTRSLVAGVTAGIVLAIEQNAIFYGTELRPYAFVLLFASIVLSCYLALANSKSRFDRPELWAVLIVSALIAAFIQPTALGVLTLFPLALIAKWAVRDRRDLKRFGVLDTLLLASSAMTLIALWRITLGESWHVRSLWNEFASATTVGQILVAWDWLWLLIVPIGAVFFVAIRMRHVDPRFLDRDVCRNVISLSLIAVTATCLYWLISWANWAPIWHVRYFIAVLPVLAAVCGGSVGVVHQMSNSPGHAKTLATVFAGLLILGLGLRQRTLQPLSHYPVALAVRGEDWREAIRWVNDKARQGDQIFLDPGLIESRNLFELELQPFDHSSDRGASLGERLKPMIEYLEFPVRGPYSIKRPVNLCQVGTGFALSLDRLSDQPSGQLLRPLFPTDGQRKLIIIRRPKSALERLGRSSATIVPFGGVSVMVEPSNVEM